MEEEGDVKPSLKPTKMEILQPKPTHVVVSEPQLTEKKKKKKKKLKKTFLPGSGTTSLFAESNLKEDFARLLAEQLKAYALGVDLFQALEQDPSTETNIRKLLKKLSG